MRAVQRRAGGYFAMRLGVYFWGFGIGRFKAESARYFDGAENDLQDMQGPAGLKAVGMGGNTTHGVKTDWAANHFIMGFSAEISPFLV